MVNNLLIVALTCLIYVLYSRILLRHSRNGSGLSSAQKSFFIQCSSIGASNLIGSALYVYMQFLPTPSFFVIIAHICWQLNHGKKFVNLVTEEMKVFPERIVT
ncbi:hypothetical protein OESDEN_24195, partial [Oesophagostomum dentatum]